MDSPPLPLSILVRELAAIVGDARVSIRSDDRGTYARDMWPRLLLAVRDGAAPQHPPDVVVWPTSVDEIARVVRLARQRRLPIVPYGAGSGVCGGAVPIHGGITIDLKRMDRFLGVDEHDLVCEAEAGLNGERLERELARRGYTLGHFPSSIYCSTLGGWLAARSAGQLSTKYGKIEDMVRGLVAVTGRGEIVETGRHGRSATGPDWTQLLVGSEGTLAVLASARLRVRPAPEMIALRGFEFDGVPEGLEAIRRVLQRGLKPAIVRLYDPFESFFHFRKDHDDLPGTGTDGGDHDPARSWGTGALPELKPPPPRAKTGLLGFLSALPAAAKGDLLKPGLLSPVLGKPRLANAIADLIGERMSRRGCLLIAGCEGPRRRTTVESGLVFGEMARAGGRDLGEGPGKHWLATRYAVSYRMPKVFEAGAFVDTMEIASTWDRLMEMYRSVREAIGRHAFVGAHFSHAYAEGCSIYFTFVAQAAGRRPAEELYDRIWKDGLTAATRAGGTISHHHGVGLMKASFMNDEHRDSMAIFQSLKDVLDPDGILNPGKMGLNYEGKTWARPTSI